MLTINVFCLKPVDYSIKSPMNTSKLLCIKTLWCFTILPGTDCKYVSFLTYLHTKLLVSFMPNAHVVYIFLFSEM